jgi:hypothetical protein
MEGINSIGTMAIAAGGTSPVALSVLAQSEHFAEVVAHAMFASLGLGANVNAVA